MTIQESNKLIAEFLNCNTAPDNIDGDELSYEFYSILEHTEDGHFFHPDEMKFHTSRDWLMPVIYRIEQTNEGVPDQLLHLNLFSTIGEMYTAVVEYIEDYNSQKTTKVIKVIYNVWTSIEKVTYYEDGEEDYEDMDELPVMIGRATTLDGAKHIQMLCSIPRIGRKEFDFSSNK